MKNKINNIKLNKIILNSIVTYIFAVIEVSLILTLIIIVPAVWILDIIAWQALLITGFIITIHIINKSRFARFVFSITFSITFNLIGVILFAGFSYSLVELIYLGIILGILSSLALLHFLFKEALRTTKILLFIGLIIICLAFFASIVPKPFFLMKIQFLVLGIISLLTLKSSVKHYSIREDLSIHIKGLKSIILLLIIICSGLWLAAPIKTVQIKPKNSPELIFWTSASGLPGESTLELCADNNIGFCVALKKNYIEDPDSSLPPEDPDDPDADPTEAAGYSEYIEISRALNNSVDIYIALVGTGFLTVDTAEDYLDIYETIRDWLKSGSLFSSSHIRGFVVDAEPPKEFVEELDNDGTLEKSDYFVRNIPSRNDIKSAEKALEELIDQIKEDDSTKEIGIVKMPTTMDSLDGDGDYNMLTKTIYNLDLDWDFSVTMNYRTQHIPDVFDYILEDVNKYDYSNNKISYNDIEEYERYLIPKSTFYYKTAIEVYSSEVNVPKANRYIFIGTFHDKFSDTSYIENREYRKDLDICRHFSVDQVWFYDFRKFTGQYGFAELEKLADYNEQKESWNMALPNYILQREVALSISYASIDGFIYI